MKKQSLLASLIFVSVLLSITSCNREEDPYSDLSSLDREIMLLLEKSAPNKNVDYFLLPESTDFSAIPQDPNNPLTAEKVALGRLLFHETGLGVNPKLPQGMKTYSCASCHHSKAGFQACLPQGIGEGGQGFGITGEGRSQNTSYANAEIDVQPLRTPSALNVAYQTNILWNGQFGATGVNIGTEANWTVGTPKEKNFLGFEGTETQAIAGMGVHRLNIDQNFVTQYPEYKTLFDAAFSDLPANERVSVKTAGLAIAAYERTLLANEAPFQRWLKGDYNAMTDRQRLGAMYFFGQANCVSCHTGPALNKMDFYALGMNNLNHGNYGNVINVTDQQPDHKGRGGFTGKAEDMYKFKVPQIYNLKTSPFYGHGATFTSIESIVRYKNNAVAENSIVPQSQLAPEFEPLHLTDNQIKAITDFIENALYDPNLNRYVPTTLPTGQCFPNNDTQSRIDLGCL